MGKIVALQIPRAEEVKQAYQNIIGQFAGLSGIVRPGSKVLLKPNFVAPFEKATTNKAILECILETVLDLGGKPIVAETSGFEFSTDATIRILGIDELCKKYGLSFLNYEEEEFIPVRTENPRVREYLLPKMAMEADVIINLPHLKGHSLTKVTFGIKNLFGLLHKDTRRKIHATDLDRGIAELLRIVHVDFTLVDGLWCQQNAVYAKPSYQGILLAGDDLLQTDLACCRIYGVEPEQIGHIALCGGQKPDILYLSQVKPLHTDLTQREAHFASQNKKYKMVYQVDRAMHKLIGRSILPYVHYYLGIRPAIDAARCTRCGFCEKACPVGAIKNGKIQAKKCMQVRCMRCLDACPKGAIALKGTHQ